MSSSEDSTRSNVMDILCLAWLWVPRKELLHAFEHAAISIMISGLSTRNIEESAREAVLIEPVSNPSILISMIIPGRVWDTLHDIISSGKTSLFAETIRYCLFILLNHHRFICSYKK